jgi:Ribonuclease G/E
VLIAVSVRADTARIALLNGDVLTEYALWRWDAPDGVGDVYTARVTAIAPAMAGVFADLGGASGFLPDRGTLSEGDYLTVRVIRAAQGGKGPRLARVEEVPADRPGLLRRGPGPLLDFCARFPAAAVIIDDFALMARLRPALGDRMAFRQTAFDPVLEDEIAGLAELSAALPGGARLHITPAPALTALDIDAGAATDQDHFTLNVSILPELARQILLRNLSGGILIDFAGMKARDRPKLAAPLAAALAADPLKPRLLGFSHLGFAEILRPRIRPPLHEVVSP